MAKYIDADRLVAEIKRRIFNDYVSDDAEMDEVAQGALASLLYFIDSLQQEQPDVNFEKELDRIWFDNNFGNLFDNSAVDFANVREICKHFYELGKNAREK